MRVSAYLSIILISCFSQCLTSALRLRNLHSSVVAGNYIYIDGGEVSDKKGVFTPENQTLAITLSTSWTNSSLKLISTERPIGAVPLNRQTLWWDEKHQTVYCFGGEKSYGNPVGNSYSTPQESIWKFTPDSGGKGTVNWTEAVGPSTDHTFPPDLLRVAGGISAYDGSRAYYVGGYVTAATSTKVHFLNDAGLVDVPGMLSFDFGSQDLTNDTAGGGYASQYGPGNWLDIGAMLSVPQFGSDGVFLLLGGLENSFNNITIYDKKSQAWHTQLATGDIPAPRTLFCAVVAQSNDSQSSEIFIHGGLQGGVGGPQNKDSDEMYILSVPAFEWFKANYTSISPRAGHTCHPAGNNQMILIGGSSPIQFKDNTMEAWNGTADPWAQGIGVFDMTNLVWRDSYNANAQPYTVPKIIKQYYDKNGSFPLAWSSPDVQALFQPSNNSITTGNIPTRHHIGRGIIVAIAVSCIFVILLFGVVAFVLLHRKRWTPEEEAEQGSQGYKASELTGSDTAAEMSSDGPVAELSGKSHILEMESKDTVAEMECPKRASAILVSERYVAELPAPNLEPDEKKAG